MNDKQKDDCTDECKTGSNFGEDSDSHGVDYSASEKAYYDTGFELEMDDNLITLVTCDHYQDYGRFVVIAREITEDEA